MESNPDSIDGLPAVSYSNDVNVVPEHEKNQLQQTVCNLEGKALKFTYVKECEQMAW